MVRRRRAVGAGRADAPGPHRARQSRPCRRLPETKPAGTAVGRRKLSLGLVDQRVTRALDRAPIDEPFRRGAATLAPTASAIRLHPVPVLIGNQRPAAQLPFSGLVPETPFVRALAETPAVRRADARQRRARASRGRLGARSGRRARLPRSGRQAGLRRAARPPRAPASQAFEARMAGGC